MVQRVAYLSVMILGVMSALSAGAVEIGAVSAAAHAARRL